MNWINKISFILILATINLSLFDTNDWQFYVISILIGSSIDLRDNEKK